MLDLRDKLQVMLPAATKDVGGMGGRSPDARELIGLHLDEFGGTQTYSNSQDLTRKQKSLEPVKTVENSCGWTRTHFNEFAFPWNSLNLLEVT